MGFNPTNSLKEEGGIFIIGLKLAGPVLATLVICDLVLGVLARTIPQMNVFIVGIPLKIGVTYLIVILSLPIVGWVMVELMRGVNPEVYAILHLIGSGR